MWSVDLSLISQRVIRVSDALTLEKASADRFTLRGDLRAENVMGVLSQLPAGAEPCQLDLAEVKNSDSAGLALLLEWQLRMQAAGGTLDLRDAPDQLIRLAQISSVDTILGLSINDVRDTKENDGA
ncbi:MAG: STAS domain-containing protein [Gammaproteobacteria bacterium]|nr:STAS domain-containing protein [Gammaproteobacteria bacterium]